MTTRFISAATLSGSGSDQSVRVTHSVAISIANDTHTIVAYDTEDYDSNGFHQTAATPDPPGNTRLTVPAGQSGKYLVFATRHWAANATGTRMVRIRLNGVTIVGRTIVTASNEGPAVIVVTVLNLAAADYLETMVYQNSGGALNVDGDGTVGIGHFGMVKILG